MLITWFCFSGAHLQLLLVTTVAAVALLLQVRGGDCKHPSNVSRMKSAVLMRDVLAVSDKVCLLNTLITAFVSFKLC